MVTKIPQLFEGYTDKEEGPNSLRNSFQNFVEFLQFRLDWSLMTIDLEDILIGALVLFEKGVI